MAEVSVKTITRTKSMWLQITLVDTLFNKIYNLCKNSEAENYLLPFTQSKLNSFYSIKKDGKSVYDSLDNNSTIELSNWEKTLSSHIQLYRAIYSGIMMDSKAKTNNGININHTVVDCIQRYLFGIRDILRNLII